MNQAVRTAWIRSGSCTGTTWPLHASSSVLVGPSASDPSATRGQGVSQVTWPRVRSWMPSPTPQGSPADEQTRKISNVICSFLIT